MAEGMNLGMDPNQVPIDRRWYKRLVGRLIHLAYTRSDLANAVSAVSRYLHDPGKKNMNVVMCILSYFMRGPGKEILFTENVKDGPFGVEGYIDADWGGSQDDHRST